MKTQYPMIPFPLIVKATDGDTEAINQMYFIHNFSSKMQLKILPPKNVYFKLCIF